MFDLTGRRRHVQTNAGLDNVLDGGATEGSPLLREPRPTDPYVSPLFGDLAGFPPTFLQTGTRDLLLSDNVRMHRALRAGASTPSSTSGRPCGHGGFLGMAPEDADRYGELRRFAEAHWAAA